MVQEQIQPKMSIVVPCYNAQESVARCLDSLLAQTFEDIEIIAVNDGSTDGTLAVLRGYEKRCPAKVRALNKGNAGSWHARWAGADAARGAYVAYVDCDDYVDPGFAEDFYKKALSCGADIVVCGFRRTDEASGRALSDEMGQDRPSFFFAEDPGRSVEVNSAVWNKCFRRSLLVRMPRLEHPPLVMEDVAFCQLAYLYAQGPVAFTGTSTYNYMVHQGSLMDSVTPAQAAQARQAMLEVRARYLERRCSDDMFEALSTTVFLHLGVSMLFRLSGSAEAVLSQEIKKTTGYLNEYFGPWKRAAYSSLPYAAAHGPSYKRLFAAKVFYRAHLMRPFLAAYRFYLAHAGKDLKW